MLKLFIAAQTRVMDAYDSLRENEKGQTMAEYGVVLSVITVGIVTAFTVFSGAVERAILRAVALIP